MRVGVPRLVWCDSPLDGARPRSAPTVDARASSGSTDDVVGPTAGVSRQGRPLPRRALRSYRTQRAREEPSGNLLQFFAGVGRNAGPPSTAAVVGIMESAAGILGRGQAAPPRPEYGCGVRLGWSRVLRRRD